MNTAELLSFILDQFAKNLDCDDYWDVVSIMCKDEKFQELLDTLTFEEIFSLGNLDIYSYYISNNKQKILESKEFIVKHADEIDFIWVSEEFAKKYNLDIDNEYHILEIIELYEGKKIRKVDEEK